MQLQELTSCLDMPLAYTNISSRGCILYNHAKKINRLCMCEPALQNHKYRIRERDIFWINYFGNWNMWFYDEKNEESLISTTMNKYSNIAFYQSLQAKGFGYTKYILRKPCWSSILFKHSSKMCMLYIHQSLNVLKREFTKGYFKHDFTQSRVS